jgi:hypothetical protein
MGVPTVKRGCITESPASAMSNPCSENPMGLMCTPHRPPSTSTRPVAIAINKMRKGRKIATMPMMAKGSFQGLSPRFSAALFQYLQSITNTRNTSQTSESGKSRNRGRDNPKPSPGPLRNHGHQAFLDLQEALLVLQKSPRPGLQRCATVSAKRVLDSPHTIRSLSQSEDQDCAIVAFHHIQSADSHTLRTKTLTLPASACKASNTPKEPRTEEARVLG